jgi:hypothetical protein
MRLHTVAMFQIGDEVRKFMHQCDEKGVTIEISIDCENVPASSAGGEITQFGRSWRRDNKVMRVLSEHRTSSRQGRFRQKLLKSAF